MDELSEHILFYHDVNLHHHYSHQIDPTYSTETETATATDTIENATHNVIPSDNCRTREAVQFSGICAGLLSLPEAFGGEDDDDEKEENQTREVYLGDGDNRSVVVFCPVETNERNDILIAIQILLPATGSTIHSSAVRESIQRCHDMFCLLRGGSIHFQLSTGRGSYFSRRSSLQSQESADSNGLYSDEEAPPDISMSSGLDADPVLVKSNTPVVDHDGFNDGCIYPGMELLYSLRKKHRKLVDKLSRISPIMEVKRAGLEKELDEVKKRLDVQEDILPIKIVRNALRDHYDEFIEEIQLADGSLETTLLGSIVQRVPRPLSSLPTANECPSHMMTASLGRTIEKLFQNPLHGSEFGSPLIVNIQTYYRGTILSGYPEETSIGTGFGSVPTRVANHVLAYFRSFQLKMEQMPVGSRLVALMPPGSPKVAEALGKHIHSIQKRFPRPLGAPKHNGAVDDRGNSDDGNYNDDNDGSLSDHVDDERHTRRHEGDHAQSDDNDDANNDSNVAQPVPIGSFQRPPPLAMIDASFEIRQISVERYGSIWTPIVHLKRQNGQYAAFKVARLTIDEFDFLIFADPGEAEREQELGDGLNTFADEIARCVAVVHDAEEKKIRDQTNSSMNNKDEQNDATDVNDSNPQDTVIKSLTDPWKESGIDIVFVDRQNEAVFVHDGSSGPSQKNRNLAKRLFFPKKKSKRSSRHKATKQSPRHITNSNSNSINNNNSRRMDKRFGSNDDVRLLLASKLPKDVLVAFDDVMDAMLDTDGRPYEVGTHLPSGSWVWSYGQDTKELYAVFPSSKYRTVADVQTIAKQLRESFFGDMGETTKPTSPGASSEQVMSK